MFKLFNKKKIEETLFSCKRDGLVIRGTEYRPEGENLPIAIVSHGFMAFQDTVRHYAKALAEQGYASYCFDFNGGSAVKGKSDGKTTEMSVLTEVTDLEAVIEYVRSLPYVNPESLLLMGCSQGGFVSALTAAKINNHVSKLVLFYPALCIPDDARAGKMMFAKFDPNNIPDLINCGPMKLGKCYVEDVIKLDPYREIETFTGDVLIIHGTKDDLVNISYAEKAYDTYVNETRKESLSRSVAFYPIENGKHGFSKKHDKIAIGYLEQFLLGKIGGTSENTRTY